MKNSNDLVCKKKFALKGREDEKLLCILLSGRVSPVEPTGGDDGGVHLSVGEDNLGVRSPSTAQVDGSISTDQAIHEGKATHLVCSHLLLRRQ